MANKLASFILGAILLVLSAREGSSAVCERENLFGLTTYFNCPQSTDKPQDQFCCGTKNNRYCCNSPLGIDDEVVKEFAKNLPVILGVIGALILGLIVVCVICCCCCPFCLLNKHRRGAVHNPNTADVIVTQPLQPMPPQQPYPSQPYAPQPYPAQPGYPPQQPYPVDQGYPPQPGYPPQQPYPPQQGYPQQPYPPQGNAYPDLTEK